MATPKTASVRLHISHDTSWRPYAVPFAKIQAFSDFQTLANEILEEDAAPSDNTPTPGHWDVYDEEGLIILGRFWEDHVAPGCKLYLVNRPGVAPPRSTRPASTSQPHHATQQATSDTPTRSFLSYAIAALALGTDHDSDNNDNNKDNNGGDDSDDGNNHDNNNNDNKVHNGGDDGNDGSNHNNSNNDDGSDGDQDGDDVTFAGAWVEVKPKTRARNQIEILIKITVRDSDGRFMRTLNVFKNTSVANLIEMLGGKPGAKIQTLRQVTGGLRPGLTYMSGTRKLLSELGWTSNSMQIIFTQGPDLPKDGCCL